MYDPEEFRRRRDRLRAEIEANRTPEGKAWADQIRAQRAAYDALRQEATTPQFKPTRQRVPVVAPAPSAPIQLGPLTQQLLSGARWSGLDQFLALQVWADDVEQILGFLQSEGRLAAFLATIQRVQKPQQRHARLAEARGALQLARHGFRIVQWEPPGEAQRRVRYWCPFRNRRMSSSK
jgi:hypothetical protein